MARQKQFDANLQSEMSATTSERRRVAKLAKKLSDTSFRFDSEEYANKAKMLWHRMPERFQQSMITFRRFGSPLGGLVVNGLPTGMVPATPRLAERAVDSAPLGSAVLSLFAAGLGEQFGFAPELSGLMIQAIVPERGAEFTQRSVSSREELYRHVETAFTPYRADFVLLFCLRPDQKHVAATTLAPIELLLPRLRRKTIAVLRQPRFTTTVDESFLLGSGLTGPISIPGVTVLSGPTNRPRLRVDFAETTGTDRKAQYALEELLDVARAVEVRVRLGAGSLVVIDNQRTLHGRTEFQPRWDGADRWLMRTFVARDLLPSEDARPSDGRIIDTDFSRAS